VIEATSGNTGIGLAMVCAQKGYTLVITMAETFSIERRKLVRFLGAKVVVTPAAGRGQGMVAKSIELAEAHRWFLTRQFENEANADFHSRTTVQEILEDFKGERLDYWVTGFGTGGTLKGVGRALAKKRPETKIVVCEPDDAPMLSSGVEQQRNPDGSGAASNPVWHPHPQQGWSTDFISKLAGDGVDMKVISQIVRIKNADAMHWSRELAGKEGIFVGITSGATFTPALRVAAEAPRGSTILHAARPRRTLSEHSAFRRYFQRHDRRRAGDRTLHSQRCPQLCARSPQGVAQPPGARLQTESPVG
jgi:cysteine synthase A